MTKSKKTNWWIWVLAALFLILVVAVIYKGKTKPKGTEVEIAEVELRSIDEKVSASGKIFPATEVKISSDVSGEIVELYVKEGDSVFAGQVLAKIDPDTYVSAVERGRATVNNSKSQLSMARAQIENSRAQIEQIRAQLENAKTIHSRNDKLLKDKLISQVEFDQSLASKLSLEAQLRAAEAGLKSAVNSSEGQEFAIKSAEASLRELQTSLSRTTIKAPMTGIISSLSVEKGERVVGTIQMTGTEMMRISNLNNMEMQVDVSENDIPKVKLGDVADIEVDAYVGKKFRGIVSEIANSAANISKTTAQVATDQVTNFIVKIQIDPASYTSLTQSGNKYPFRPGMSGSVEVYTNRAENVVAVPIQSVTVREKDKKDKKGGISEELDIEEVVFVMDADTAKKVLVVTGLQDDRYIEIKSGIKKDDKVISGPFNLISKDLKVGEKVRIKEEKKDDKKK
ncbi:MAG TPA: efflux RND transporter periplasmic adaptor subunit [Saprospiraceae bacterium]|nr:efflux RND transporter periplasmic adaptor subunit [Saprospiraceae bacterium]